MQKALFLDRDGVINVEKEYLYKIEDFEFIDGIFEVCKKYQELGYALIVVTNQSGIARGIYTERQFRQLTRWMIAQFLAKGLKITQVYHCPHHPDITGSCACRKPKAGMLLQAQQEHNIDLKNSIIIGDKERDIEAGINAGLQRSYLLSEDANSSKATKIIKSLRELL